MEDLQIALADEQAKRMIVEEEKRRIEEEKEKAEKEREHLVEENRKLKELLRRSYFLINDLRSRYDDVTSHLSEEKRREYLEEESEGEGDVGSFSSILTLTSSIASFWTAPQTHEEHHDLDIAEKHITTV